MVLVTIMFFAVLGAYIAGAGRGRAKAMEDRDRMDLRKRLFALEQAEDARHEAVTEKAAADAGH